MATLRSERKLATVNRDSQKEHPRNNFSRDSNVPAVNEDYIKKLFWEFSRTENRILGSRSVKTRQVSSELTRLGANWNRSGDFPDL